MDIYTKEINAWMPITPAKLPFAETSSFTNGSISDNLLQDDSELDGLSCTEILGLADGVSAIQQHPFQIPLDAAAIQQHQFQIPLGAGANINHTAQFQAVLGKLLVANDFQLSTHKQSEEEKADGVSAIEQHQLQIPPDASANIYHIDQFETSQDGVRAIEQHQLQIAPDASANFHQIAQLEAFQGLEKVNDEVSISPSKPKKQKTGLDKKLGEKRQNKYYWPKIDVQKVQTPKSKTPKSKTPKPKTPKPQTPKPQTPKPNRKKLGKKDDAKGAEILEHAPNCKRSLNFEEAEVKTIEKQHVDIVKQGECSRVYRRLGWKCLKQSRILGPSFAGSHKKKRSWRNKKSNYMHFEDFNFGLIPEDLLDRIAIVKCKRRMLVPTKEKIVQEDSYKCVLSLLCSTMKFIKKKRSAKKKRGLATSNSITKQASLPDEGETVPGSCSLILEDMPRNEQDEVPTEQCESGSGQLHERTASSSRCSTSTSNLKSKSKVKVAKEKTPKRTYKRKDKREDYLSKLDDWHDISLEQIMDPFIKEFEAMKVYDDPKKLERWSVVLSEPLKDANGAELPNEENPQFREERAILQERIFRFLTEMTKFQGRKEFVKWNGSVLDSMVGVFLTQNVSDVLSSNAYMELASRYPIKSRGNGDGGDAELSSSSSQESVSSNIIIEYPEEEETIRAGEETSHAGEETIRAGEEAIRAGEETIRAGEETIRVGEETAPVEEGESSKEFEAALNDMLSAMPYLQRYIIKEKKAGDAENKIDWDGIRLHFVGNNINRQRNPYTNDSVDWEAVRKAPVAHIAKAIISRGQHCIIAAKIQKTLNRLVHQHGTLDVEWLREAPPQVAKAYLLSFYGLGLKSVECLRLLTLHHHGFPVDVNIARTAIRLGWVPLKPLPAGLPFHLLQKYPIENEIQQYLWPRLCHLKQESLYQIHYQMITFGKVFCLKKNPNCRACPFKQDCKYYKSLVDSVKMKHPLISGTHNNKMVKAKRNSKKNIPNPFDVKKESPKPLLLGASSCYASKNTFPAVLDRTANSHLLETNHTSSNTHKSEPIFEFPVSPKKVEQTNKPHIKDSFKVAVSEPIIEFPVSLTEVEEINLPDIEDLFKIDGSKPVIEFPASPKKDEETNLADIEDLFKTDVSEADEEFIVIKLESQVCKQTSPTSSEENNVALQSNDVSTALVSLSPEDASIYLPKQINPDRLRTEHQVYELPYNHLLLRELDIQQGEVPYLLAIWTQGQNEKIGDTLEGCSEYSFTVPGTILIPVRTAMRGSFPLNGTYFQVNEVFADDESSRNPINVPTSWIWMLEKRTLYCGSGTSSIFRGLTEEAIQRCCWEGGLVRMNHFTSVDESVSLVRINERAREKLAHMKKQTIHFSKAFGSNSGNGFLTCSLKGLIIKSSHDKALLKNIGFSHEFIEVIFVQGVLISEPEHHKRYRSDFIIVHK